MSLKWNEHPAARQEFFDALIWYDDQEHGLGDRLADEFADTIRLIREWPEAGSLCQDVVSRYGVRAKGPSESAAAVASRYADEGLSPAPTSTPS